MIEATITRSASPGRQAFPYRHATRLLNRFQLRVGTLGLSAFDGHIEAGLIFFMIHRAAMRAPADRRISVNGIATSLQQSTETLRRAARVLVDAGLCRSLARGVERAPDFATHPLAQRLGAEVERHFAEMLSDYERCGLPLPAGIHGRSRDERVTAALDAHLSVLELGESRTTKPVLLHVIGAVTVLNASRLTADPDLGWLYGHDETVPPDVLRCPATTKQITAESGLPATTAWRHLTAACEAGFIRRVDGGYLLADALMANPIISARSRGKIEYLHRVFNDLAKGRYVPRPASR